MSLITSASTWINDDTSKKRPSTMRKTIKMKPNFSEADEYVSQSENYQNSNTNNMEETQNSMHERNSRVNDLLNKITSIDNEQDDKLGNFNPLPNPNITIKKDMDDDTEAKIYVPPVTSYATSANLQKNGPYKANDTPSGLYSNYNLSYQPPVQQPYYSKVPSGSVDDKFMEKINYMIHLLEEQQFEKTNNITEEFILYTFLGVFIIFVVDSFARSGKYIR